MYLYVSCFLFVVLCVRFSACLFVYYYVFFLSSCFPVVLFDHRAIFLLWCCIYVMCLLYFCLYMCSLFSCYRSFLFYVFFLILCFFACLSIVSFYVLFLFLLCFRYFLFVFCLCLFLVLYLSDRYSACGVFVLNVLNAGSHDRICLRLLKFCFSSSELRTLRLRNLCFRSIKHRGHYRMFSVCLFSHIF